jgi:hypothetical protein
MEQLDLVELNDTELTAVVGGFNVVVSNSTVTNSFNNSGNISITNSSIYGLHAILGFIHQLELL